MYLKCRFHDPNHVPITNTSCVLGPLFIEELGLTSEAESDMAETEAALSEL